MIPTGEEERQALVVLYELGRLTGRPKALRVAAISQALASQRARYEAVAKALETEADDEAMQRADAMRDAAERIRAVGLADTFTAEVAGFDPDEPHRLRTSGTQFCTLCGRIASDRVHNV